MMEIPFCFALSTLPRWLAANSLALLLNALRRSIWNKHRRWALEESLAMANWIDGLIGGDETAWLMIDAISTLNSPGKVLVLQSASVDHSLTADTHERSI